MSKKNGYLCQVKEMINALLSESEIKLSDEMIETIIQKVSSICINHKQIL